MEGVRRFYGTLVWVCWRSHAIIFYSIKRGERVRGRLSSQGAIVCCQRNARVKPFLSVCWSTVSGPADGLRFTVTTWRKFTIVEYVFRGCSDPPNTGVKGESSVGLCRWVGLGGKTRNTKIRLERMEALHFSTKTGHECIHACVDIALAVSYVTPAENDVIVEFAAPGTGYTGEKRRIHGEDKNPQDKAANGEGIVQLPTPRWTFEGKPEAIKAVELRFDRGTKAAVGVPQAAHSLPTGFDTLASDNPINSQSQDDTNWIQAGNTWSGCRVRVCHLLRNGVAAIFGPQSAHTASHVQSICDTMEIPHLETRWDYRLRRQSCLVNLYPHPTTLSKAYVDLVKAWGWKSFTIIYENNEGLVRLQELLKAHGPSEFPITVRQLSEGAEYRPGFRRANWYGKGLIELDLFRYETKEFRCVTISVAQMIVMGLTCSLRAVTIEELLPSVCNVTETTPNGDTPSQDPANTMTMFREYLIIESLCSDHLLGDILKECLIKEPAPITVQLQILTSISNSKTALNLAISNASALKSGVSPSGLIPLTQELLPYANKASGRKDTRTVLARLQLDAVDSPGGLFHGKRDESSQPTNWHGARPDSGNGSQSLQRSTKKSWKFENDVSTVDRRGVDLEARAISKNSKAPVLTIPEFDSTTELDGREMEVLQDQSAHLYARYTIFDKTLGSLQPVILSGSLGTHAPLGAVRLFQSRHRCGMHGARMMSTWVTVGETGGKVDREIGICSRFDVDICPPLSTPLSSSSLIPSRLLDCVVEQPSAVESHRSLRNNRENDINP
ncbi:Glutamate receptor, ionotropic kainate 2 [Eufriesea mexicana]|uniref:Glutamate receptor, ionotropic kainate 2 n=1 Tax=Eufriesea mexicana TaxID=516756 RepID=A0A310SX05_9HYME|nr:Glutamate receptor, ionotropic kainate 2 [Eufriesea mexicana]